MGRDLECSEHGVHPCGDKDVDSIVMVVTLMDCSEIGVHPGGGKHDDYSMQYGCSK